MDGMALEVFLLTLGIWKPGHLHGDR